MDVCSQSAIKELCDPQLAQNFIVIWDKLKYRIPHNDNSFCLAIYLDLAISFYTSPYYSLKYISPDKQHSYLLYLLLQNEILQSISHITAGSVLASTYVSMITIKILCDYLFEIRNISYLFNGALPLHVASLPARHDPDGNRIQLDSELINTIMENIIKESRKIRDIAKVERMHKARFGGRTYGRYGSLLSFLENPESAAKIISLKNSFNKVSKLFMQEFPDTLAEGPFQFFYGIKSGVMKMMTEMQIKDILPQELTYFSIDNKVVNSLGAVRLVARQVQVYERIIGKIYIFVDKSGSMYEKMKDGVPKISAATALAHTLYRKYKARVYAFDTKVHEIKGAQIESLLLRIKASGGTNIANVLRKILYIKSKDSIYIIITDAIDDVDYNLINKLKTIKLNKNIFFILVPPGWERYWLKNFQYHRVNNVAHLASSVKRVIL